ncbi:MAG: hypothetical protein M1819_004398 [Sarea resinae]|nr:MAG: hypothetical protein M1819_004398 [Sarea resinae]
MYVAEPSHPPSKPPPLSVGQFSSPTNMASSSANMLPIPPQTPPGPQSTSTISDGRIYSLDVVQQPVRARSTANYPTATFEQNGKAKTRPATSEIDISFYVLTVDLWSSDGMREVNLVRHSATSPSISAATSSSYPPPPQTPPASVYAYAQAPPPPPQGHYQTGGMGGHQAQLQNHYAYHPPPPQAYYPQHPSAPITPMTPAYYQPALPSPQQPQPPPPSGMFTRNLIGSLSASAQRLADTGDKIGVWFILQDLSVRTEGQFRSEFHRSTERPAHLSQLNQTDITSFASSLKMNFVDVGEHGTLNTARAPVLASTFSDVFQVFSAKKFPGVIESTNLSKCFATQGIKIPIRKDGPKALSNREDYENDD